MSKSQREKIIKNLMKKPTFINGILATYQDKLWLLLNIEAGKEFIKNVINKAKKLIIITI